MLFLIFLALATLFAFVVFKVGFFALKILWIPLLILAGLAIVIALIIVLII